MRITSANIKSNPLMLQYRVKSDIERVKKRSDVVFWQEIAPKRYKDAIRNAAPEKNWHHRHMNLPVPVSLRKNQWEVLDSGIIRTHRGKRLASPDRWIVWVVAQRKGTDKVVAFVNTHFVSGAWNSKPKLFKEWRKQVWNVHYKKLQEVVDRFHKAGYTVVGGGDWNRINVEKFQKGQRWLYVHAIDYLFGVVAKAGTKIKYIGKDQLRKRYTDHMPIIALVAFKDSEIEVPARRQPVPNFDDLHAK